MIGYLIMFTSSVMVMVLGFVIWKRGKTDLIMSYHQNNIKDIEGYGNAMGKTIFSMGIITLITGFLFLFNNLSEWISLGFMFSGITICIIQIVRIQRKYNRGVFLSSKEERYE